MVAGRTTPRRSSSAAAPDLSESRAWCRRVRQNLGHRHRPGLRTPRRSHRVERAHRLGSARSLLLLRRLACRPCAMVRASRTAQCRAIQIRQHRYRTPTVRASLLAGPRRSVDTRRRTHMWICVADPAIAPARCCAREPRECSRKPPTGYSEMAWSASPLRRMLTGCALTTARISTAPLASLPVNAALRSGAYRSR